MSPGTHCARCSGTVLLPVSFRFLWFHFRTRRSIRLAKLGKRFSGLAKRMSAQLLEIYRQLEKFSSFLLFILSHANGAPGRDFPLFSAAVELWRNHWILGKRVYFMQNTPWECAAGQAVGHRIGGASSADGIPGARGCGGSLHGCMVPLGLIGDKFVELKGLTLPVLDLIK